MSKESLFKMQHMEATSKPSKESTTPVSFKVLAPSFDPQLAVAAATTLPRKERLLLYRDMNEYLSIQNKLGKIMRPNFENETNELVLRKYVPNSKHDIFYRSLPEGHGRWLCGGNRSGKTESGIREDVAWCLGFRPWYPRSDESFRPPIPPPVRGRIVCEDWEKAAKGTIVPKLRSTIPPELLHSVKKNQMGVEYFWEIRVPYDATRRVSVIEIVTNKTDPRALEGWGGDFLHFDEPPRKAVFTALTRGIVDTNGYFWMTLTPLEEQWILDEIVLNQTYEGQYVSIWENIYDPTTGAGFLTKEGIENFAAKLSEIERRTRLYGEFAHLSGRIFTEFSPRIHVYPNSTVKMEDDPPHGWWRGVFIDPGRRKPHTVIFTAWSPTGDLYIYDGFRIGDVRYSGDFGDVIQAVPTTDELVAEINKRLDPYPQQFFVDSYANEPDWDSGLSMFDQLLSHYPMETWPKVQKYPNAIEPLARLMHPDPATGKPKFFIHSKLTRGVWELERYRWDNWSGRTHQSKDPKATPVQKDDDYVDCILAAAMLPPPEHIQGEMDMDPEIHFDY